MATKSTQISSAGNQVFPDWMMQFLPAKPDGRYKIAWGGRGSGKSYSFARMLVVRAAVRPIRALCGRELQSSISDSVHALLSDQIKALGLSSQFDVQAQRIYSRVGSEIMFRGLRGMNNDASALKSLEGVDICWLEEAQCISQRSFQTLTPTIRKKGAEIWATFNPDQETDPIYTLAMNPPPGSVVRKVNYDENPWFSETSLEQERAWMARTDPDAYAHVWLGECRKHTDAQVLKGKYIIEAFETPTDVGRFFYGADWGFSQDPTAIVRCFIRDNRLYIDYEQWGIGVELEDLPAMFDRMPDIRRWPIKADAARPETISFMKRRGFNIAAARKWPGSVEDGIAYLRSFDKIVIHERCKHAAEEARLYSYKVDSKSGDILNGIIDKNNHVIDGVRYSLDGYIKPPYDGKRTLNVGAL
jgi:phage terminase large subunit